MLSRIADSLFWQSRYMERANGLLRMVETHYLLSLDKDIYGNKTWRTALQAFSCASEQQIRELENDRLRSLHYLLVDPLNDNSLKNILGKARENARGVQDHITKEVWEVVNQMYHLTNNDSLISEIDKNEGIKVIDAFTTYSTLYTGVTEITMFRGQGWDFMCLGKYIERCLQTVTITEKQLQSLDESPVNDILYWRYLLLALSGYELHLKSYHTSARQYNVFHQIILNENFTRSVLYSLKHIDIYLKRRLRANEKDSEELLRRFGQLMSKINYLDPAILEQAELAPFLEELRSELLQCGHRISEYFFSYY